MANKPGNWNLNEFITFLLIHASYADFDFSEEEEKVVKSLLSEDDYQEISQSYDDMGEYQIVETILSYKGLHYPTAAQKQEMLGRMMQLFNSDGDFSTMEKKLYDFFDKLL